MRNFPSCSHVTEAFGMNPGMQRSLAKSPASYAFVSRDTSGVNVARLPAWKSVLEKAQKEEARKTRHHALEKQLSAPISRRTIIHACPL